jgi:hypothetical protein
MPPIRTPLAERNSSGYQGPELSKYEKGRIIGMHNAGKKDVEIHRFYDCLYSTVQSTIRQDELRKDGHSIPRPGAPKSWTLYKERRVLRHVRSFPKDTYAQVITAYSVGFKKATVKKILKLYSIEN